MNKNEPVTVNSLLCRVVICITLGWATYDLSVHGRALFSPRADKTATVAPLAPPSVALAAPGSPMGVPAHREESPSTSYTPVPAPRWTLPATPQNTAPPSFSGEEPIAPNSRSTVNASSASTPPPTSAAQPLELREARGIYTRTDAEGNRYGWCRQSPGGNFIPCVQLSPATRTQILSAASHTAPTPRATPNPYAALAAAAAARPRHTSSPLDVIGEPTAVIPAPILSGTHP